MGKNCVYCKCALDEQAVVDVCRKCGISVWGEKMFNAIIQNMENAREVGDLYQGSVSEQNETKTKNSGLNSIAEEALAKKDAQINEQDVPLNEPSKPTSEDVPPLVEPIPEVETLDSKSELTLPEKPASEPAQKPEDAVFIVDNLS